MKIRFTSLLIMLSAACMLTSCLKDDDDNTQYDFYEDTGISAFSLGTMNRYLHTTTKAGTDSVYKVTYTGSRYKFSIDQLSHRIYNTDSLPYGTDLKHVIATINSVNNGMIFIQSLTSDSLVYYSTTDSLDFSQPRTVRIVAQDGQRYVDYNVSVNARKVPVGSMSWERKAKSSEIAQLNDIKALTTGGKVYVFGTLNGQTLGYSTAVNDGATWTPLTTGLPSSTNVIAKGSALYAISNGAVLTSTDGSNWTTVATNAGLKQVVAASTAHLYALTTSGNNNTTGIASSTDDGKTWSNEELDADASYLPDANVGYTCTPLRTNDSIDEVMIVGRVTAANDILARAWTKVDDYSSYPVESKWSFVDNSGRTSYALGEIPSLAVTTYSGNPVALVCKGDTISPLLVSHDEGLTWENSGDELPSGLNATTGKLAMVTDSEGSLWIIANGIVWKH